MSFFAKTRQAESVGVEQQVRLWIERGEHAAALQLLEPFLQGSLPARWLRHAAGDCYWALGQSAQALAQMQALSREHPEDAAGWARLGGMAMAMGQTELARKGFETSLRLEPNNIHRIAALNHITPFPPDSACARRLRRLASSKRLPEAQKATALNALGRIEHEADRFRPAFRYFLKAKSVRAARYVPAIFDRLLADQKRLYAPDPASDRQDPSVRIVFILGMPRSGTTLVEHILSGHPQVRSLGESPALTGTLLDVRARIARRTGRQAPWDWVALQNERDIAQARVEYLTRTGIELPCAGTILSKMPLDALNIGLAARLLPEARFIVLRRHPLDTGLSNLMTNFHQGHDYATRLDWIGHFSRIVHDATEDYAQKLEPERLRLQSYRELVTNPEVEIAALRAFAGLSDCPRTETPDRVVHTASMIQVREEINRKGLDRWQDYEAQLTPMIASLGGADWLAQWEAQDTARWPR